MKKTYEAPSIEVVKFQYRDQVVVASGKCDVQSINESTTQNTCDNWEHNQNLN